MLSQTGLVHTGWWWENKTLQTAETIEAEETVTFGQESSYVTTAGGRFSCYSIVNSSNGHGVMTLTITRAIIYVHLHISVTGYSTVVQNWSRPLHNVHLPFSFWNKIWKRICSDLEERHFATDDINHPHPFNNTAAPTSPEPPWGPVTRSCSSQTSFYIVRCYLILHILHLYTYAGTLATEHKGLPLLKIG